MASTRATVNRLVHLMDTQFEANQILDPTLRLNDHYTALLVNAFRTGVAFMPSLDDDPIQFMMRMITAIETQLRSDYVLIKQSIEEAEKEKTVARNADKGLH